jgi:hypothetical protein
MKKKTSKPQAPSPLINIVIDNRKNESHIVTRREEEIEAFPSRGKSAGKAHLNLGETYESFTTTHAIEL